MNWGIDMDRKTLEKFIIEGIEMPLVFDGEKFFVKKLYANSTKNFDVLTILESFNNSLNIIFVPCIYSLATT